jgi:hypothetical protein
VTWKECEPLVPDCCATISIPAPAAAFVAHLRNQLTSTAQDVDQGYPDNDQLTIDVHLVATRLGLRSPCGCCSAKALLWNTPLQVTQQAVEQRLNALPAPLSGTPTGGTHPLRCRRFRGIAVECGR